MLSLTFSTRFMMALPSWSKQPRWYSLRYCERVCDVPKVLIKAVTMTFALKIAIMSVIAQTSWSKQSRWQSLWQLQQGPRWPCFLMNFWPLLRRAGLGFPWTFLFGFIEFFWVWSPLHCLWMCRSPLASRWKESVAYVGWKLTSMDQSFYLLLELYVAFHVMAPHAMKQAPRLLPTSRCLLPISRWSDYKIHIVYLL